MRNVGRWLLAVGLSVLAGRAWAADYPAPREADFVVSGFRFHTGQVMPALRLHYVTVGNPAGETVLILHGTNQSARAMLTPAFAGALFGPGQALDARRYFIVIPDAIGVGGSAKPSDGMRAGFPHYDYADMVLAQYRLVTEGLHIHHLRLVMGNSMGGMHVWLWGEAYPGFMDGLVPMASQPTAMASRNWMTRRMVTELVRRDPGYDNGNYTTEPASLRLANVFMGITTSGGTLGYQGLAPTRATADKLVDERLAAAPPADANDFVYQWDASGDYDAMPGLGRISAPLLAINSADDERNPPETGLMAQAMRQVKGGRLLLIPASAETRGHGTTMLAKFYQQALESFLVALPRR
jgi:homoserine O-acetyltransferase